MKNIGNFKNESTDVNVLEYSFKKGDVLVHIKDGYEVTFLCITTDPTQFKTIDTFQFRLKEFRLKK